MPSFICHHKGRFNIYSTVSDGFKWENSVDEAQLTEWYTEEYGRRGAEELPPRLQRAKEHGTSSLSWQRSLADLLYTNRAGDNGKRMTIEDCIKRYLS